MFTVQEAAALTTEEQAALRDLSVAVNPPDLAAVWPGREIEWARPQWHVICWSQGQALSHVGAVIRNAVADGKAVKIGGIGGVKTHPQARRRGLAAQGIHLALERFARLGMDFALLVCECSLIPLYERLGWKPHSGGLLVSQRGQPVPFTFNVPMTHPVANRIPPDGVIDLKGPPW